MYRWFVLIYLLATLLAGLRPYFPAAYRCLRGSHVGAYNMFTAGIDRELTTTLKHRGGSELPFDGERYFWMNPLINTTHSHVDPQVLEQFARFLSDRAEIRAMIEGTSATAVDESAWRVVVSLGYQRNGRGDWKHMAAEATLRASQD